MVLCEAAGPVTWATLETGTERNSSHQRFEQRPVQMNRQCIKNQNQVDRHTVGIEMQHWLGVAMVLVLASGSVGAGDEDEHVDLAYDWDPDYSNEMARRYFKLMKGGKKFAVRCGTPDGEYQLHLFMKNAIKGMSRRLVRTVVMNDRQTGSH